jgi:anti-sigma factor RsiW
MTHLTEEQLIAYRDGETRNRESVMAHLKECSECAQELQRIEAVFAALDAILAKILGYACGSKLHRGCRRSARAGGTVFLSRIEC